MLEYSVYLNDRDLNTITYLCRGKSLRKIDYEILAKFLHLKSDIPKAPQMQIKYNKLKR